MTRDQWIAAAWIFGGIFVLLTIILTLNHLMFGSPKKEKQKEAWHHHEDGLEGKY